MKEARRVTGPGSSLLHPPANGSVQTWPDIVYTTASTGASSRMDVYAPNNGQTTNPTLVLIHGGAWSSGDKSAWSAVATALAKLGWTVVCPNYRYFSQAVFPAQIIDIKCCIRSLRSSPYPSTFRIWTNKIGVWGESAGGHLAALAAATNGYAAWDQGLFPGVSSTVAAARVDYAPWDLTSWVEEVPAWEPTASGLLGAPIRDNPDLAAAASPLTYVSASSVPMYMWHGDADPAVLIDQSQTGYGALRSYGVPAGIQIQGGMGHEDFSWYTPAELNAASGWFDKLLRA